MLNRLLFKIFYWQYRIFVLPKNVKELRSMGLHEEADRLEAKRHEPAPESMEELITSTRQKLCRQGRYDEATQFGELHDRIVKKKDV